MTRAPFPLVSRLLALLVRLALAWPGAMPVSATNPSAGPAPLAVWYDKFAFRAAVSPELAPGTELVVPVTQTCANGQVASTEVTVPGQPEPRYPAPRLTVTAAPAEAGHDHAAMVPAAPAVPAAHDQAAPAHDHGAAPAKP